MLTFWLVLTYDLLEERLIDDVIIKTCCADRGTVYKYKHKPRGRWNPVT